MKYTINTHYSHELINEAALAYWKKNFTRPFIVSLLLMILALGRIFILDIRDWLSGTFLCFSIIFSLMIIWAYFIYRNRSLAVFEEMEAKAAELIFSEEGLSVKSDTGSAEVKWKMFKRIIKTPNTWVLVYKNNSYSFFPVTGVSYEVLEYISEKVVEHGGQLK